MAVIENYMQITLEELEENVSLFKLDDYIIECEGVIDRHVCEITEHLQANPAIRAVFISGPTASGKTTFNHKISENCISFTSLHARSRWTITIISVNSRRTPMEGRISKAWRYWIQP